jgi:hypothetical protein
MEDAPAKLISDLRCAEARHASYCRRGHWADHARNGNHVPGPAVAL